MVKAAQRWGIARRAASHRRHFARSLTPLTPFLSVFFLCLALSLSAPRSQPFPNTPSQFKATPHVSHDVLSLTYSDGSTCPTSSSSSMGSVIAFVCDHGVYGQGKPEFVASLGGCHFFCKCCGQKQQQQQLQSQSPSQWRLGYGAPNGFTHSFVRTRASAMRVQVGSCKAEQDRLLRWYSRWS